MKRHQRFGLALLLLGILAWILSAILPEKVAEVAYFEWRVIIIILGGMALFIMD